MSDDPLICLSAVAISPAQPARPGDQRRQLHHLREDISKKGKRFYFLEAKNFSTH
ncbi:hypothetical protein [Mesorhizobium sp. IMUNJ 23232]|uniref:hypothetical protein n=1 Tax=Mesorhizobium sp. IMUNJ 23232 TaxID=3376064 RepID=UPI0037BA0D8E